MFKKVLVKIAVFGALCTLIVGMRLITRGTGMEQWYAQNFILLNIPLVGLYILWAINIVKFPAANSSTKE